MSEVTVRHLQLTHVEYHSELEHDSSTALATFRQSSLKYYHQRITKRIPPMKETDSMRMGSALHTALLEPEAFERLYILIPTGVLSANGAKSGGTYNVWAWEHRGKIQLKASEYDEIRWQVESVQENPLAVEKLAECNAFEESVFVDGTHHLKCRYDGVAQMDGHFLDLKRTSEPCQTWWRKIRDFDLHCQMAFYARIFRMAYGAEPVARWIIVQDKPPYECEVHRCPTELLKLGHERNIQTLKEIQHCRVTGNWYRPSASDDSPVHIPEFFYRGN